MTERSCTCSPAKRWMAIPTITLGAFLGFVASGLFDEAGFVGGAAAGLVLVLLHEHVASIVGAHGSNLLELGLLLVDELGGSGLMGQGELLASVQGLVAPREVELT